MKPKEFEAWLLNRKVPEPSPYLAARIVQQARLEHQAPAETTNGWKDALNNILIPLLQPRVAVAAVVLFILGFLAGYIPFSRSSESTQEASLATFLYYEEQTL